MISEKNLSRNFDDHFNLIEDLSWLPWVGVDYPTSRIMIIGESHYEDGDYWQEGNRDTTRIHVSTSFEGNPAKLRMIIEKVILGKELSTQDERERIWRSCVYLNLVQRLLKNSTGDLKHEDLLMGWNKFFQLVDILKPDYCLVLAKGMSGSLGEYLNTNDTGWDRNIQEFYEKEKVINLRRDDEMLKLLFINHPTGSRGFDYLRWSDLIEHESPEIKMRLVNQ